MKKQISWSIDEEIIKEVKKEAKKKDRSDSFIANSILKEHFKK